MEYIIFDANFFIMLLSVKVRSVLDNLNKTAKELGFSYQISQVVFDEIKANPTYKNKLKTFLNIEKILKSTRKLYVGVKIDLLRIGLISFSYESGD